MAGPGAKEVGRVGIRVVPDLTGFRTMLRAQLAAMKDLKYEVDVVPNLKGFASQMKRAGKLAKITVPIDYEGISRLQKKVGPDVDLSSLTPFEQVLLNAYANIARIDAGLRKVRARFDPIVRSAQTAKFHFDGMVSSAGRIPDRLRQVGVTSENIRDLWQRIEDRFQSASDRASEFGDKLRDVRSYGDYLRAAFQSVRDSAQNVRDAFNGVDAQSVSTAAGQMADSVRESTNNLRAQQPIWQRIRDTARNIGLEIRDGWDFSKMNRSPFAGLDGEIAKAGSVSERWKRSMSWVDFHHANVNHVLARIRGQVRMLDKDTFNVAGNMSRVGQAAAAAGRDFASSMRGIFAGGGGTDFASTFQRAKDTLTGLPERVRAFATENDRAARSFLTIGDNLMDMGRTARAAFLGLRNGVNTLRNIGSESARSLGGASEHTRRFGRSGSVAGSTFSMLGKTVGAVGGLIGKSLGMLGSAVKSPITAFQSLGHTGKLVVAVLALLPGIIGLVGGLLAGLPALLFAGAAGFGAIWLGLDGIKEAAGVLLTELGQLKVAASTVFKEGLTPVFESFRALMPMAISGVQAIAGGLVSWAQGIGQLLTSAYGMERMSTILQGIGTLFRNLTPFIQSSMSGFMTWGAAGASMFGLLSNALNNFGNQWMQLAERTVANGSFQAAIQGLTQVVEALFSIWLQWVEYGLGAAARMAGPTTQFLTGLLNILLALMPVLEVVFTALSAVVGALGTALGPVIQAILPPIRDFVNLLAEHFVTAFNALVPVITTIAQFLGQFAETILTAIAPVLPVLSGLFQQLAGILGPILTTVLQTLTPVIQMVATYMGQLLMAVAPLLPPLAELAGAILGAIVQLFAALLPVILPLIEMVLPMLIELIRILVPALTQIIYAIIPIIPIIVDLGRALMQDLGETMQIVRNIIADVWPWIRTIIGGVCDFIVGIIKLVAAVLRGDWGAAWDAVKQIVTGAANIVIGVVGGLVTAIISFCVNLGHGVINAFAGAGQWLINAGRAILEGLWNGMKAVWSTITGWLGSLAAEIANLKGPIEKDRVLLIPQGGAIMDGLHEGMEKGFEPVRKLTAGFADRIAAAMQDANLGQSWVDGIVDSTPRAIAAIDDVMSAMTNGNLQGEWRAMVEADDFGDVADRVADALAQWGIQIDQNGLAKMVNKSNTRKARRR